MTTWKFFKISQKHTLFGPDVCLQQPTIFLAYKLQIYQVLKNLTGLNLEQKRFSGGLNLEKILTQFQDQKHFTIKHVTH